MIISTEFENTHYGIQEVCGSIPLISTILGSQGKARFGNKTSFFFSPMQISISPVPFLSHPIRAFWIFRNAPFSYPEADGLEEEAPEQIDMFTYYAATDAEREKRKSGGAYVKHTGTLKHMDEVERMMVFADGMRLWV